MNGIKKKILITLAPCIVMFLLIILISKSKEDIVTLRFNGQNDYWEVNIIYTINQDLKTIKRGITLISNVDQPELAQLDITVNDNNSWTSIDSMELSKGMVKGEKKISTYETNYNQDIVTFNSVKIDIFVNNSEKQNILLKKVE